MRLFLHNLAEKTYRRAIARIFGLIYGKNRTCQNCGRTYDAPYLWGFSWNYCSDICYYQDNPELYFFDETPDRDRGTEEYNFEKFTG